MTRYLIVEEFHVTLSIRRNLSETEATKVRQVLNSAPFIADLRQAVTKVLRGIPTLYTVRFTLSR